MSNIAKLIGAIAEGESQMANVELAKALRTKVNTALDIKRVAITSDIYKKASK